MTASMLGASRAPVDRFTPGEVEITSILEQRAGNRELFRKTVVPLEDRFVFLEDGTEVAGGLVAKTAFGHSVGHMMYRVKSAGKPVLIWGDVASDYVFSILHPDSKVAFDVNKEKAIATRNRVLSEVEDSGVLAVGHHMAFPGVGYVERSNGTYRWVPTTYQLRL